MNNTWTFNIQDHQKWQRKIPTVFLGVVYKAREPDARPIFRSNSKFAQIMQCSGLKCTLLITTKFCTRQCNCRDVCKMSLWSVLCILKLECSKFFSNFEFDRNIVSGTGAWWSSLSWTTGKFRASTSPQLSETSYKRRFLKIWEYISFS